MVASAAPGKDSVKIPCRSSGVGTVERVGLPLRILLTWKSVKKNVLFLTIGAPAEAPNSFWLYLLLVEPSKKLRASRALLRRYSNAGPCSWLVPALLPTNTVVPPRLPYCAE